MNDEQHRALTEHEVATRLNLSVATLRAWRSRRKGPRFVRFGRAVRYLPADVERFVQASVVGRPPRPTEVVE
jgi:predicted DNA-binding transcriptional regulator AlpA